MNFKKIIAAAAALTIAIPAISVSLISNATPPIDSNNIISGDANIDYVFNLADIVLFQRWLKGDKGLFTPYNEPGPGADTNNDGKYDIFDLIAMRRLLISDIISAPEPSFAPKAQNLCAGIKSSPQTSGIALTDANNDLEFINSQTNFTIDLFKATYNENKGQNDLISPYSVIQALGMTANGANGKTLKEMENVLGDGMNISSLNRYLRGQRESTVNTSDRAKWSFSTANSIWAINNRNLIQVLPSFIQNCVDYYNSEFYIASFDESTVEDVNNWVNEKTKKMIPSILNAIEPDDVMYLVNAVAFEAEWNEPYEKYMVKNSKFTAADGTEQDAEMMSSYEKYICDDNTQGIIKEYSGRRYAFAALLPEESTSLDKYIDELTSEKLNSLLKQRNMTYEKADTKLPKFKFEYENELNDELIDMGMPTAFSHNADFSNMSAIADINPIYIGYVKHKTFIDLDENGTKAAAATIVAMKNESFTAKPEKELVFDRPFVFCIFDTETNIPIFIGALNSLS